MHSIEQSITFSTRGKGGLIKTIPSRGFVLVFNKFKKGKYEVYKDSNTLFMNYKDENGLDSTKDVLENFIQCNIKYYIYEKDEFYIVIIKIDNKLAKEWADDHDFEVPINAFKAIIIGRKINKEFILAHRTFLGDNNDYNDSKQFSLPNVSELIGDQKFDKLSIRLWDNIHIPYDGILDQSIYKKPILNDRLYLNILYDILTNDYKLGGAQFDDYRYLNNNKHPLEMIFVLNKLDDKGKIKKLDIYNWRFFLPSTWIGITEDNDKQGIVDDIRDYYGEYVAFYFLFTIYYISTLYPLVIIGCGWLIFQLYENTIPVYGSTIFVLIAMSWSTIMTEYWYRLEWAWRFKWGMIKYDDNETPQPTFTGTLYPLYIKHLITLYLIYCIYIYIYIITGQYVVSPDSGSVVETHAKPRIYIMKIVFSLTTMFLCICIVISSVGFIWILKNKWRSNMRNSIAIGIINALQIQILNELYTYLAVILNNFENHRLKLEYYNHLVIKRIIFIVINSFNSLFYIAFYESGYKSDEERLVSLRIQLLTLFFTAIVLQNSWELLFPFIWFKFKQSCIKSMKRRKKKKDDNKDKNNKNESDTDIRPLIHNNNNAMEDNEDIEDIEDIEQEHKSNDDHLRERDKKYILSDIDKQLICDPMPSLLDNTAEVVVLHGYIILFVVIFPAMPILALINNYFELGIDYYNLLRSQRPIPYTSNGIGVWKIVISSFNILAVFSNMALLSFRTNLIRNLPFIDSDSDVLILFFVICMILISLMILIRNIIDDQSSLTQSAIKRQRQCEKFLKMNTKKDEIDNFLSP